MRKRENKNYSFVPTLPEEELKIPNKFKKLKNASMASFKGRIGWKRPRKKEKKILSLRFVPTQLIIENSKKTAKMFKKIKKYHYGSILSHHRLKEDEKGRK